MSSRSTTSNQHSPFQVKHCSAVKTALTACSPCQHKTRWHNRSTSGAIITTGVQVVRFLPCPVLLTRRVRRGSCAAASQVSVTKDIPAESLCCTGTLAPIYVRLSQTIESTAPGVARDAKKWLHSTFKETTNQLTLRCRIAFIRNPEERKLGCTWYKYCCQPSDKDPTIKKIQPMPL